MRAWNHFSGVHTARTGMTALENMALVMNRRFVLITNYSFVVSHKEVTLTSIDSNIKGKIGIYFRNSSLT